MMFWDEKTLQYVMAHADDDVSRLALQPAPAGVNLAFALQQIKGRQKAQEKLPDFFACQEIVYPPTVNMEQCSSTLTAQYKASLVAGVTFADLSGGFGVDTFQLSTRFSHGFYVEPNESLAQMVQHNMGVMGIHNVEMLTETMERALPAIGTVDWLYVDPSRRDTHGQRVVGLAQCVPDVVANKAPLLEKASKGIMLKLSPMLDIREALRLLPETTAVHVVAVHGECKELLFLLAKEAQPLTYTAVNMGKSETQCFCFTPEEEAQAVPTWAGKVGEYLYEPNAAIMKAGGYKILTSRYPVCKLGPSTHLYTADEMLQSFPGRCFRVLITMPFHKSAIRGLTAELGKANVAVRNFPLTADELRNRLKIRDGGNTFIIGTTIGKEEKVLVVAEMMR
ncbi:MAG: SAM-dependent methyltransferase [Bacteroidales bacterium]|nr:SAM-dependent methyltransferase [Bacteroidales bacterium]